MNTVVPVGTGVQATVVYAAARDASGVAPVLMFCVVPDDLDATFSNGSGLMLIVSNVGPLPGHPEVTYTCTVLSRLSGM